MLSIARRVLLSQKKAPSLEQTLFAAMRTEGVGAGAAALIAKLRAAGPGGVPSSAVTVVLHACEGSSEGAEAGLAAPAPDATHDNGNSAPAASGVINCAAPAASPHSRQRAEVLEALAQHPAAVLWDERLAAMVLRAQCDGGALDAAAGTLQWLHGRGWAKARSLSPLLRAAQQHRRVDVLKAALATAREARAVLGLRDYHAAVRGLRAGGNEPLAALHHLLAAMAPDVPLADAAFAEDVMAWCGGGADGSTGTCAWAAVSSDGCCAACGTRLKGFPFTKALKEALLGTLRTDVVPSVCRGSSGRAAFDAFARQVDALEADVLIDGANVGYFGLASWYPVAKRRLLAAKGITDPSPQDIALGHHRLDVPPAFDLIDTAMAQLRDTYQMQSLVFLHRRHGDPRQLRPEDAAILQRWQHERRVYFSPNGINDDLCWLYAALSKTPASDEPSTGRPLVHVLTNDLMRDHIFALFDRTAIGRWRDRCRIGFDCAFVDGASRVSLQFPPPFTQCLQFDVDHAAWHIPVQREDGQVRWLCMR